MRIFDSEMIAEAYQKLGLMEDEMKTKKDRKYLKRWRRDDRAERGDMTFRDWLRMTFGRKKKEGDDDRSTSAEKD